MKKTKKKSQRRIIFQFIILLIPLIDFIATYLLEIASAWWTRLPDRFGTLTELVIYSDFYHRSNLQFFWLLAAPYILTLLLVARSISTSIFKSLVLIFIVVLVICWLRPDFQGMVLRQRINQVHSKNIEYVRSHLEGNISVSEISITPIDDGHTSKLRFALLFDKGNLLPEFTTYNMRVRSKNHQLILFGNTFHLTSEGIKEDFIGTKRVYDYALHYNEDKVEYNLEVVSEYARNLYLEVHYSSQDSMRLPNTPVLLFPLIQD